MCGIDRYPMRQSNLWQQISPSPRVRVISDNDYSGDPDGLVQLAHHLLSPSVLTTAIIATRLRPNDGWGSSRDSIEEAVECAERIVELCHLPTNPKIFRGASHSLPDRSTPIESEGAREIIREAMRDDTDLPLYIVCGASLTEIASAWLLEPRIADRLTVVWIGGHEHEGLAVPPPGGSDMEYNLHVDPIAGQVLFNDSNLKLWQVPRDSYRSVIASFAELHERMSLAGELGAHLFGALSSVAKRLMAEGYNPGETYVLGDSPLVLLTALQTTFEPDASSSEFFEVKAPLITDSGLYEQNPNGRTIRVFRRLDNRVLLEDLYSKLSGLARQYS